MQALTVLLIVAALIGLTLGGLALYTQRVRRQVEAEVPRVGRVREVDGGAIHWIAAGSGRPILFIHGFGGQMQHFTYGLAQQLVDDFKIVAIDRPGCGWSERDGQAQASIRVQANMIAEFLRAEGIERPVVVGHSLGGAIALSLALDHPEQVGALALLCPLTHPMAHEVGAFKGMEIGSPGLRRFLSNTVTTLIGVRTGEAVLRAVFEPEAPVPDFPIRAGGLLGLRPKSFRAASEEYMAVPRAIETQAKRYDDELKTPGGVLFGAEDKILPPAEQGEVLARKVQGFAFETLDGCGHMIPITQPEACADFIRRMAALKEERPAV